MVSQNLEWGALGQRILRVLDPVEEGLALDHRTPASTLLDSAAGEAEEKPSHFILLAGSDSLQNQPLRPGY
uniref:Uncharacterized protein n=1 Tax=Sphaerodactylus townsendi TaxID=933632 RepID=A0ACB8EZV8_9SAUR